MTRDLPRVGNEEAVHAAILDSPVGAALLGRELRLVAVHEAMAALNARPIEDHTGRLGRGLARSRACPWQGLSGQPP